MAYFNHAFRKVFLGTGVTRNNGSVGAETPTNPWSDGGYVTTTGVATTTLNTISAAAPAYQNGYFGLFDAKGDNANRTSALENCCSVYMAGSAIYSNDKIGPFHGGYQETNKSKVINPRYVSQFYFAEPCLPQNQVVHVGNTLYTDDVATGIAVGPYTNEGVGLLDGVYTDVELTGGSGSGAVATITVVGGIMTFVQLTNGGTGYTDGDTLTPALPGLPYSNPAAVGNEQPEFDITAGIGANCCKEFLCGETYSLRIDLKGSPALRFLNHNSYYIATYYTGCCDPEAITPTPVDSTLVFIGWANDLLRSPLINPFIRIAVTDEAGNVWYAPGTVDTLGNPVANTWDHYVSPGHTPDACAGFTIFGAYVDTRFGDCTFQISDFYEKEPIRIYASEVDFNGDPCAFNSLCVITECEPTQANGFGETVLRDLILSESYRQNFFHSDFRIREITQGNQIVNTIDRAALYTKYYLLHNVPRFNNPTSTFDNDQYMLEIIGGQMVGGVPARMTTFEVAVIDWLSGCNNELCDITGYVCETSCTPVIPVIPED